MTLDEMAPKERVSFGKEKEDVILNCLNKHYKSHGYNLIPGTSMQDRKEKTDCWQVTPSGKKLRSAIKARVSKNDILVAMRDPFYGVKNEETVVGRDVLYEYFQYITLSKDGETIRVANGKVIHKICEDLWQEFLDKVGDIDLSKSPYNSRPSMKILSSEKYPGCELWLHKDKWSYKPKILGFIPPSTLKENKEIKFHKLIEE